MSRSILKPIKAQASKLKTWGDYNYTFKLQTQGTESMYQTSKCWPYELPEPPHPSKAKFFISHLYSAGCLGILYADAKNNDGIPLAIKCEWFRVKGDRPYKIPQISSNVY